MADTSPGALHSVTHFDAPSKVAGSVDQAKLMIHWMAGAKGAPVKATSLFFTPKGQAPAGGWPLVAWVHGTQTVGTGPEVATVCSASASPTLDGGLTADGFTSNYADIIAWLLDQGYAVVAPDLEGLGAQAGADGTDHPYYNLSSSGASVSAAVLAARAQGGIAAQWASVGHSEGGHVVLGLERSAAPSLAADYRGAVAIAPFVNIAASIEALPGFATVDPENAGSYLTIRALFIAMFTTALLTHKPSVDPAEVAGPDLLPLLPAVRSLPIFHGFGAIGQAMATNPAFTPYREGWAAQSDMAAFLSQNDLGTDADYRPAKPTLILQGTKDPFVFEPLQTPFVQRLVDAGAPVTYKVFDGADHGTIVLDGTQEMAQHLRMIFG